ncbi:MAG: hypothetical protein KJO55_01400, partial [Gammaproteobacteria bacterium]|nr:hypothetical protein [Gammaproteobacteria bacterium]
MLAVPKTCSIIALILAGLLLPTATIAGPDCNGNGFPDTMEADEDSDGTIDSCDNCRETPNARQRDTDGDGFGNYCDPDLSNDGNINFADLSILQARFFSDDPDADFTGDGIVNFDDVQIMRDSFFASPGPGAGSVEENDRPFERADLKIVALESLQPYPGPGELTTVRVTVDAGDASQEVTESQVTLYDDDVLVGMQAVSITRGATSEIMIDWTPATTGVHGLQAIADPDGNYFDRDPTDNASNIEVVVAAAPPSGTDLAVSELLVISQPDRPYIPIVSVANEGPTTASAPLIVSGNGNVFSSTLIGPLAPGESLQLQLDWPADEALNGVTAVVNPRYVGAEPVTFNNTVIENLQDPVDLAVERLSVSQLPPIDGQPHRATISLRVRNVGLNPVGAGTITRISINAIDTSNIDVITPAIAVGEVAYISKAVVENQFTLTVTADFTNLLNETNRLNNIASRNYTDAHMIDRWTTMGPAVIAFEEGAVGRMAEVVVDPTDGDTLYAASFTSKGDKGGPGVWRSQDGGSSWVPVADSLPSLAMEALAIDPNMPSRIYGATADAGIFRSDDKGDTWVRTSASGLRPRGRGTTGLYVDPSNSSRLFLSSHNGIYRSSDAGVTWDLVLGVGLTTGFMQDAANPAHLWAAISAATDVTGIYESYDSGTTWTNEPVRGCPGDDLPDTMTATNIVRIAQTASRLYASYRTKLGSLCVATTVYRTTGATCTVNGLPQRTWERAWQSIDQGICESLWSGLYAHPTDPSLVYHTGVKFYMSEDGGDTFTKVGNPDPHADHHSFAFAPDGVTLYVGTDGGVYRSSDRGLPGTWSFASGGMAVTEFYDLADAESQPGLIIGGTQDNGTAMITPDAEDKFAWEHIRGGDGGTVEIDPLDPDIMYTIFQYAYLLNRTTDGGDSVGVDIGLPVAKDTCFNFPFELDPANPSTVVAACVPGGEAPGGLWRLDNPGAEWELILESNSVARSAID